MKPLHIFAALAALFVVSRLFASKKDEGTDEGPNAPGGGVHTPTEAEIRAAIRSIRNEFGLEIARNVERIYRLETRNFQSGGFQRTNAAGMAAVPGKMVFPWGWPKRGTTDADYAPIVEMQENGPDGTPTGPVVRFIAFKYFNTAARYLARFLQDHGNNAGRWRTTDPNGQARYVAALQGIATPYANT